MGYSVGVAYWPGLPGSGGRGRGFANPGPRSKGLAAIRVVFVPEEHLLDELKVAAEERPDRVSAMDALDRLADEWRHAEHLDARQVLGRRQRNGVGEHDLGYLRVA